MAPFVTGRQLVVCSFANSNTARFAMSCEDAVELGDGQLRGLYLEVRGEKHRAAGREVGATDPACGSGDRRFE